MQRKLRELHDKCQAPNLVKPSDLINFYTNEGLQLAIAAGARARTTLLTLTAGTAPATASEMIQIREAERTLRQMTVAIGHYSGAKRKPMHESAMKVVEAPTGMPIGPKPDLPPGIEV
jgi:hypothetical protein